MTGVFYQILRYQTKFHLYFMFIGLVMKPGLIKMYKAYLKDVIVVAITTKNPCWCANCNRSLITITTKDYKS